MKKLLISLVSVMLIGTAQAQQYNTAFGVRADWSSIDIDLAQLSIKHYFNSPNALETNIGFGRRYLWTQFNYQQSRPFVLGSDWYWGAGADIGYWNRYYDQRYDPTATTGWWSGIGAMVGAEYTFCAFPINLALDAGPNIRMIPEWKLALLASFSCRFALR